MTGGIIIVDKPAGWTSQDVVSKLRGVFHERRIGHGGTLDPMATGVLPVFVGRATRAVEFFESAEKEYIAGLRLGLTTDTQDTTGTPLSQMPVSVTDDRLRHAMAQLLGEIEQVPPMYSAVKIGGKKLYELARQGKEIARPARKITIFELELLAGSGCDWTFRVKCSKGTYVRTLCAQIGQLLGCGGCMSSLRRTQAGCFTLADALPLEQIVQTPPEALPRLLRGVDTLFADRAKCSVTQNQERSIRNGAAIRSSLPNGNYRVYAPDGTFLCIARQTGDTLKPVKSFFEVDG